MYEHDYQDMFIFNFCSLKIQKIFLDHAWVFLAMFKILNNFYYADFLYHYVFQGFDKWSQFKMPYYKYSSIKLQTLFLIWRWPEV